MATGMALTVAQTLFAALQCKELRDLCSAFRYESQLDELQNTVTTIENVLLTAESKQQELTPEGRDWVESLKDAVYDVDDLLDEFRTMAQQRRQMSDAKISKKVRRFFSRSNKFLAAFNASHDIKKIKNKLDSIAKNRSNFGFGDTYEPVGRREDTFSFVQKESIIGRETEKEDVVGMLLHQGNEALSFVTIVGIGGLGKTALAQLVFNDGRIKSAFKLMKWVCVSEDFSMEGILSKMVQQEGLKLERLQQEVRREIEGQKYLLVLDDVWEENRNEWVKLRDFLNSGDKGSRVLVTSRSKKVAGALENNSMYLLGGLSDENSWSLFKEMAFGYGKEPVDTDLVEMGKEILKKCANVPLSIRIIGSLLYGQGESKWLSFKNVGLSNMGECKEGIFPVLKFSYYHLTPSLKSCFSYCALFPKDFIIYKQFLINLWMAQGCLDAGLQDGRSMKDVGDEYFSVLLQRCFLQDITLNEYNEIDSCKMHDLIHDLAQEVAGKEFSLVNTIPINRKTRHVSISDRSVVMFTQNESLKNLRTIVLSDEICPGLEVIKILAHGRRLRVLRLRNFHIESIPSTLCSLIHLRYLDLSYSYIEMLPKSITKLLNLKVLDLCCCGYLKELPKDLGKLVNLRQLDIRKCYSLNHMPAGLDNMTSLHTLTMFVLGKGSSNQIEMGQVQDLKHLGHLRGEIEVRVREGYSYDATKAQGGYILNKSQLKALTIQGGQRGWEREVNINEALLEGLRPHFNVERLDISGYIDTKLPNWAATLGSSLPLLVSLRLETFPSLQHLPSLSQLQHLKFLQLSDMNSVEYMEDDDNHTVPFTQGSRTTANVTTFFPSLETLEMKYLQKLNGWWKDDHISCSFPRLHTLTVTRCPNMTSFPGCQHSHLKKVELMEVGGLKFCARKKAEAASESQQSCVGVASSCSSSKNNNNNDNDNTNELVEELTIDNIEVLNSLIGESRGVRNLCLQYSNIGRLLDARTELLKNSLQHLQIYHCEELEMEEEGDGMMPWKDLHSLTRLSLGALPKMVNLPKGFQYLTSLQSLHISQSQNLEALPEWLDSLTSLQSLTLHGCGSLTSLPEAIRRLPSLTHLEIIALRSNSLVKRCTEPDGEECPKIRHIPELKIRAR